MKKINVITIHRIFNYGTVWQTYATVTILKRMGHRVEVIDYVPEYIDARNKMRFYFSISEKFKGNIFLNCNCKLNTLVKWQQPQAA